MEEKNFLLNTSFKMFQTFEVHFKKTTNNDFNKMAEEKLVRAENWHQTASVKWPCI
jgi:hypothetical protein